MFETGSLINGTTITSIPLSQAGESCAVNHVETEAHEIIFANGAPAATSIDNVSRRAFDNCTEFEILFGDQPEMKELPHPPASNVRILPARINRRLGIGLSTKPAKMAQRFPAGQAAISAQELIGSDR